MNSDYIFNIPHFLFQVKGIALSELAHGVLVTPKEIWASGDYSASELLIATVAINFSS
jgi:hypothetical protein